MVVILLAVGMAIELIPPARDALNNLLSGGSPTQEAQSIDDAEHAMDAGEAKRALTITAAVVSRQSDDAQVDLRAGNVAVRAGDPQSAEHYYQLGESADSHNPWNFIELGELYARQNRYSDADAQLRSAMNIAPTTQFLHYDLGVVELAEHLNDAALVDFQAELKRSPGYGPAISGERQALIAMGRKPPRQIALVRPSPSPRPAPSASPGASPSPAATATPTPTPAPTASPTPLPLASIAVPSPTAAPAHTPRPKKPRPTPAATVAPTPVPTSTPVVATRPTPLPMTDLAADAKSYVLGVGSDIGFTGDLPAGDPSISTAALAARINAAKASSSGAASLLQSGAAALRSGRLTLALSAFLAASSQAPTDWRAPYCAGLTAQAQGNFSSARDYFSEAVGRGGGSPALVGLAVADLEEGDDGSAISNAQQAASSDPNYEPGRFVAGMLSIVAADVPGAESNLAAAVSLGGAPERTQYFLDAVRQRQ